MIVDVISNIDVTTIGVLKAGPKGLKGDTGEKAWSPIFAAVEDDDRIVFQIADWVGGTGAMPATGDFIGEDGWVEDIEDAVDFRGAIGLQGISITGAAVDGSYNLIITFSDASTVNAGYVRGAAGTAATVAVGTVTTLAAGSPATVVNAGTSGAAVFNFGIPAGVDGEDGEDVQTFVDALTSKTTPVDADTVLITDSAASGHVKKTTWANVKATLKTYFDTLYQAASLALTNLGAVSSNGGLYRTAANTYTARSIAVTANQLAVTNGDGVSGDPTIGLHATDILVPAIITIPNTGLHLLDTDASHDLIVKPGSNLTSDRTLTVTTGDNSRNLDISASDVTISAFSATYLDDANPAAVRATLGIGADTFGTQLLHVVDEKSSSTDGGGSVLSTWTVRDLNTVRTNEIAGASVSSNQITLPAGTYFVMASAPAYKSGKHKARLINVSGTSINILGTNETSDSGDATQTCSIIRGRFTTLATTVLRVEHWVTASRATDGFGLSTGSTTGATVYTEVMIWKVA
jgi:hypothetical protein